MSRKKPINLSLDPEHYEKIKELGIYFGNESPLNGAINYSETVRNIIDHYYAMHNNLATMPLERPFTAEEDR